MRVAIRPEFVHGLRMAARSFLLSTLNIMKLKNTVLIIASVIAAAPAFAHISYKGDFGTLNGVSTTGGAFTGKTVTGNYGWADAADNNAADTLTWGDSHKSTAFTFALSTLSSVTFTALANGNVTGALGGLLPGFSVYQGTAAIKTGSPATFPGSQTSADYDTSAATMAWRNTLPGGSASYRGVWNATGDWKVGGDGDVAGDFAQLSSLSYKGSAFATSGTSASGTFVLGAGTYSVFVGGNDFGNYPSAAKYGLDVQLSVTAVPEPETYAMLLAGLGLMGAIARRRKASANGK